MGILELMAAPFAECMVLVGIHTYLGIHVLRRRVIFVDLALAQIAALGTMLGFLFGVMPETHAALIVSMAFTFLGAAVFSLTRVRGERIPQEAVIGLVYAITAAIAVLVVEKTQGGEHLKEILVGCILWVSWTDVATAAVAYTVVGVIHLLFYKKFFLISEDPEEAERQGLRVRAWDFFFYVTFGFVISFSTRVAGVLLVFVFLVAPAIMAFLITDRLKYQLLIGWAMGTVVTLAGLLLSFVLDLPSGPSVVAFYGVALTFGAVIFYVVRSKRKIRALGWIGAGVGGAAVVVGLFIVGTTWLSTTSLARSQERSDVAREMGRQDREQLTAGAATGVAGLRPIAAVAATSTGRQCQKIYDELPDAEARLAFIQELHGRCKRGGIKLLRAFLADPETPAFFRSEGVAWLKKVAGQDFGIDPDHEPADSREALLRLEQYQQQLPARPPQGPSAPVCVSEC